MWYNGATHELTIPTPPLMIYQVTSFFDPMLGRLSETQYIKFLANNIYKGIFSSPHTNSWSLYLLV